MISRRKSEPPRIEVKVFTVEEIDRGIPKLKRRIEEVNNLDPNQIHHDDTRIKTAETNIRETIREVFCPNSPEFRDHQYHHIWHGGYNMMESDHGLQRKFAEGIPQTVLMLEGLVGRLEEKRQDLSEPSQPTQIAHPTGKTRRIFLVHGHDEEAKQTVARFLERLELEPIILHEQPNEGRTVIEKFEKNADVEYAVILLTPDDIGYPQTDQDHAQLRARQNVILELGYFIGRLTRNRVCALYKGSIELPSDYHGVLYITMDEGGGWKLKLAKEIKQSGLSIDLNLAI